jgi:rhodanese-related sulfurtransferase
VTLVEMGDQILAPLDVDMARIAEGYLERHGLRLALNDGVAGFERGDNGSLKVLTKSGKAYPADIVILALGVRPDIALAKMAGAGDRQARRRPRRRAHAHEQSRHLCGGRRGRGEGRRDRGMEPGGARRSDEPAGAHRGRSHRRSRLALPWYARDLDHRVLPWRGGLDRRQREDAQAPGDTDYEKIYLYPNSHASYYPGARPIAMKVIFRKSDGKLLGAQALGEANVDKRISALAMALRMGATVYDLEEAELCYAPQFGSAKDPVNLAGMVAANVLRGDMPLSHWDSADEAFLLDVREPVKLAVESEPRAVNIPLGELRGRLAELPRDQEILVICRSGRRAYYAMRMLLENGFKTRNLSGGMLSRFHSHLLVQ